MKNIFLTGEIKVGKSTLLNKALQSQNINVLGFKTLPVLENDILTGFTMQSLKTGDTYQDPYIGKQLPSGAWTAVPETFERYGVNILKAALAAEPDLILMDELGFFESQAREFQKLVHQCLASSIPVLGVIKPISTPFLDAVRAAPNTVLLKITKDNRNERYFDLAELLAELLKEVTP